MEKLKCSQISNFPGLKRYEASRPKNFVQNPSWKRSLPFWLPYKRKTVEKGPTHIPQNDRVYFEIATESGKSQNVFVDRNYAIGRVISSAAGACPFSITELKTESDFPLDANKELNELLDLGLVLNGDKLIAHWIYKKF